MALRTPKLVSDLFAESSATTKSPTYKNGVYEGMTAQEPALGNPTVTGYVLSSTTGGTRSWVAQGGGAAGDQQSGGLPYQFDTATTNTPASGKIRYNNATLASVTNIYINEADALGVTTDTYLDDMAVGDWIMVYSRGHSDVYHMFQLTADFTSGSGVDTVPVAYRFGSGAFSNAEAVSVDCKRGNIAVKTHASTSKATPVDADELPLVDTEASNILKKLTWANLKATVKSYFDTLYLSRSGGTVTGDMLLSSTTDNIGVTILTTGANKTSSINLKTGTEFNGSFSADTADTYITSRNGNHFNIFTASDTGIGTNRFKITNSTGNIGIGTTAPTAALHIKAGTASANTAPLKLTSGTILTTPEAGAMEYDGTALYWTDSTPTRRRVQGYTLQSTGHTSINNSFANSAVFFLGGRVTGTAPSTSGMGIAVPRAGTIRAATIVAYCTTRGTLGVGNPMVGSIVVNTSATEFGTTIVDTIYRVISGSSINVAVVAGDLIEWQLVMPAAWTSAPNGLWLNGTVYIE